MTTSEVALIDNLRGLLKLAEKAGEWRRLVLDKPEDRLYHAEDGTWWMKRAGSVGPELVGADPPPEVQRMREALERIMVIVNRQPNLMADVGYWARKGLGDVR